MSLAADFGNYARVPTQADIDALKALGVTRTVIGSSFGSVWQQQASVCEAAGFKVQEYQFPENMRLPCPRPWWVDVEISQFHTPTQNEVRGACLCRPIGIYTSKSQWDALWPSWDIVAEFPWLQLWTANYGPLPRPFTPYGGWTKPAMVQYHDTMDVGTGFEVDLSVFEEEGEVVLVACGDSPSGYRLYQLAVPPVWILDPIQAQVLQDLSGAPKLATWGQLQALGAK